MKRDLKADNGEWFYAKFDPDRQAFSIEWCGGDDRRIHQELSHAKSEIGLQCSIARCEGHFALTAVQWFESLYPGYIHYEDAFALKLKPHKWEN